MRRSAFLLTAIVLLPSLHGPDCSAGERLQELKQTVIREQRTIQPYEPARYQTNVTPSGLPRTVAVDRESSDWLMPLDQAIQIALENAEAIRVSTGPTMVVNSGRTIYDTAIQNTKIDSERGRFDPKFHATNTFTKTETPTAGLIIPNFQQLQTDGFVTDGYQLDVGLDKTNIYGGMANFGVEASVMEFNPNIARLNPQERTSLQLSYIQPLLQGAGKDANLAPIWIAKLDTSRTYYQFRGSLQDLVYSVIESYWLVASARVDVWAREQQVEQGKFSYERAQTRKARGLADSAEVTQTRLAYTNFQAVLVTARSNLLERENALRNLLFLPPASTVVIKPISIPHTDKLEFDWDRLLTLADVNRPDLKDIRTTVQIDQHKMRLMENQNQAQLNLIAQYRWNALQGNLQTFGGGTENYKAHLSDFTDWTLGVHYEVPLGRRDYRAQLRAQELTYARDLAQLKQAQHAAQQQLAAAYRELDRTYTEYEAHREARKAAAQNLQQQRVSYEAGRTIFLNVLNAITDWGNSVSAEVNSLVRYNIALANLERQSGTILQTHGIEFFEGKFESEGPWGKHCDDKRYPRDMRPGPNGYRYPTQDAPIEEQYFEQNRILDPESDGTSRSFGPPRVLPYTVDDVFREKQFQERR